MRLGGSTFLDLKGVYVKVIIYILLGLVLILTFASCDRFERDFAPLNAKTPEDFVKEFSTLATISLSQNNITPIMASYDKNYLNRVDEQGIDNYYRRNDIEKLYRSTNWTTDVLVSVSMIETTSVRNRAFKVTITDTDKEPISWHDVLVFKDDKDIRDFRWVGNQEKKPIKNVVIVQNFTSVKCANCVAVSVKLKELNEIHKDKMIYLKYYGNFNFPDVDGPLSAYNFFKDEVDYYGIRALPQSMLKGERLLTGGGSSILNSYTTFLQSFVDQEAEIEIEISNATINSSQDTVTGSASIFFGSDLGDGTSNLYLYYTVYRKEVPGHPYDTSHEGNQVQATNVVRARGSKPLINIQSGDEVSFSLPLEYGYEPDCYLVVWVQRIVDPLKKSDGDSILNATQVELN